LRQNEVWDRGFLAPQIMDEFEVEQQRVLKEKHLKLRLRKGNTRFDAIQFNFSSQTGNRTRAAGLRSVNEYTEVESTQLLAEQRYQQVSNNFTQQRTRWT
jgi:single-stranded-DNA-specific exonuclease